MITYRPRRAMESAWPFPSWFTYFPWVVVATLTFVIVAQLVAHEEVSWGLVVPIVINTMLGCWLPVQRRWTELLDPRRDRRSTRDLR